MSVFKTRFRHLRFLHEHGKDSPERIFALDGSLGDVLELLKNGNMFRVQGSHRCLCRSICLVTCLRINTAFMRDFLHRDTPMTALWSDRPIVLSTCPQTLYI